MKNNMRMRMLISSCVISAIALTGAIAIGRSSPLGNWVPDHPLMARSEWTVRKDADRCMLFNSVDNFGYQFDRGERSLLSKSDEGFQVEAPKNRTGSPFILSYGHTSEYRERPNNLITHFTVGDQMLTVSFLHGRGVALGNQQRLLMEQLVRAFAARAMALNAKTSTTEIVNGGNVPGFKITRTGKHVARLAEMASRLGWSHEFFPDDGYVMLTKASNQVKVFLGSRTVKKNGVEIQLDTPTMEEGGRVFVDRGLIQVLTGS
ncbi:MAG: stalk domain-containing protein [Fimbriimonadaceae bacterium]